MPTPLYITELPDAGRSRIWFIRCARGRGVRNPQPPYMQISTNCNAENPNLLMLLVWFVCEHETSDGKLVLAT